MTENNFETWFTYQKQDGQIRKIITDGYIEDFTPSYLMPSQSYYQVCSVLVCGDANLRLKKQEILREAGIPDPTTNYYLFGNTDDTHILVYDIENGEYRTLFKHKILSFGRINIKQEVDELQSKLDDVMNRQINWTPDNRIKECKDKLTNIFTPIQKMLEHYNDAEEVRDHWIDVATQKNDELSQMRYELELAQREIALLRGERELNRVAINV